MARVRAATKAPDRGRKAPRELRRRQLIDATIDVLAEKGYAALTLSDVANAAGLSHGIVNFHFNSKRELLHETLRFLSDEYRAHVQAMMDKAGKEPLARLTALVRADFHRSVSTKRKLAAWLAFWGEAQARPTYQSFCGAHDEDYHNTLVDLLTELGKADEGYKPLLMAHALGAALDGLWLKMMFDAVSREDAEASALEMLKWLLPRQPAPGAPASPQR